MRRRYIIFLLVLGVALVFSATVIWEFGLESMLPESLTGPGEEDSTEHKWEFVQTSTLSAIFAMLLMIPLVLRLITRLEESTRQKLELEREKVRQAEKSMREKSDFIASLSHEMRTPLNGIIGFSDLLASQESDPTKASQLALIQKSGQTLLTLINDLLDLSKIESGKFTIEPQTFNIFELMNNIEDFWSAQIRKNVELQVRVDKVTPDQLIGDATRIEQILHNLIANAAKFTEIGHIRISLSGQLTQSGYLLSGTVDDTGPGMSDAFMENMFDRFTQQAGKNHGGSGLGLAISKNLANVMGGDITVSSKLGQGTSFAFSLVTQLEIPAVGSQDVA